MSKAPRFPKREEPLQEVNKHEVIVSYLEREVEVRQVARYAMHTAEEEFKTASAQYELSTGVIEDLLQDLSDVEQLPAPAQGFAQFDET